VPFGVILLSGAFVAPVAAGSVSIDCDVTNQRTTVETSDFADAVADAQAGDTLVVDGVCESANVTIDRRLTLRGADTDARLQAPIDTRALHITGGPVAINDLDVFGGRVLGRGGAIWLYEGSLTMRRSDVVGGQSVATDAGVAAGGGIAVDRESTLTLIQSSITDNVADSQDPTRAAMGGGLWVGDTGRATVVNSTIAENVARSPQYSAEGGGISVSGRLTLIHATIVDNEATGEGGDGREQGGGIRTLGDVTVDSSIIARNNAASGPDCWGEQTSAGHNLVRNRRGCDGFKVGKKHDIVGTKDAPISVKLGVLGWHGGTTRTVLVKAGSPAIDAAGRAPCERKVDQRGVDRPQGQRCDIGSFEKRP
jgi:hypothetical protein